MIDLDKIFQVFYGKICPGSIFLDYTVGVDMNPKSIHIISEPELRCHATFNDMEGFLNRKLGI